MNAARCELPDSKGTSAGRCASEHQGAPKSGPQLFGGRLPRVAGRLAGLDFLIGGDRPPSLAGRRLDFVVVAELAPQRAVQLARDREAFVEPVGANLLVELAGCQRGEAKRLSRE